MFPILAHIEDNVNDSGLFNHMTDNGHFSNDGGYTILWMVFFMLVTAIAIGTLYVIFNKSATQAGHSDESVRILKSRYAKGEITKKQYDEMKNDLS